MKLVQIDAHIYLEDVPFNDALDLVNDKLMELCTCNGIDSKDCRLGMITLFAKEIDEEGNDIPSS